MAGGSVSNSGTALISGSKYGIKVAGAAGTISNAGTIAGGSNGVYSNSGGRVTNQSTGTITASSGDAVHVKAGAATVDNAGYIKSGSGDAVYLGGGGRVIDHPGAAFVGNVVGHAGSSNTLELASAATAGTLSGLGTSFQNFNTIIEDAGARWTISGSGTAQVALNSSAYLDNTGTLTSPGYPAVITTGGLVSQPTLVNLGTIESTSGTAGTGVFFGDGGDVINGQSGTTTALISGGPHSQNGIRITGAAGTVTNFGTIEAPTTNAYGDPPDGIDVLTGGYVANNGTASLITGVGNGVLIDAASGSVSNAGTISGGTNGVYFIGNPFGGTFNETLVNSGTISGGTHAVYAADGATTRVIVDPGAVFVGNVVAYAGKANVLELASAATTGTISGIGSQFVNFATLVELGNAKWQLAGSNSTGVTLNAGAYLDNLGTLSSGGVGISGSAGGATVVNAGTIAGSGGQDSVLFGGGNDRLVVDPGAVFSGTVDGGAGGNTLELASAASTGTLSGLGSQFVNFGTVIVDAHASWVLADAVLSNGGTLEVLPGASVAGAVGFAGSSGTLKLDGSLASDPSQALAAKIIGFTPGDTIDLAGVSFAGGGSVSVDANNLLHITESGVTFDIQLDPNTNYAGARFAAASDGGSGTDVTMTMAAPPPATPAGTTADMIVQDTQSGLLKIYDLGNNTVLGSFPLGQIGLEWQLLGLGGFTGTDTSDFILRQSGTNALDYFDVENSQIVASGPMGNIGAEWQVLGFGDFSGNPGETDMLMRDSGNNAIDYFDIQHNQIVAAGAFGNIGAEWQVLGVGDFSGNPGESDMLMRDTGNGAIDYFDIAHNQIVTAGSLGNIGVEWQVAGFADVSSNPGESDMVMRDTGTGAFDYFDIQHNQIFAAGPLTTAATSTHVFGLVPA